MPAPRTKKPKLLHIGRLFPNMITLLGLCAALSAVRYALAEKWEIAVGLVLVGAFMDGIDGRVAKMLRSTSQFGAQLDSLCDVVNFGVVPPLMLFLWQTHEVKRFGWACVLFFAVCCVLRLARFNTQIDSGGGKYGERFFQGVPAPAAAILCLSPLMISLWNEEGPQSAGLVELASSSVFLCIYTVFVGSLMISNIPSFSIKKLAFSPKLTKVILLGFGVLFIVLLSDPWLAIPLISLGYLLSLPYSRHLARKHGGKSA